MTDKQPLDRMRSDRWQIIGISVGIILTLPFIADVDGVLRYVYLGLGGAIGALAGLVLRKLVALRKPKA